VQFPVCNPAGEVEACFGLSICEEDGAISLSESTAYKLYCHMLIQQLPVTAFKEAIESLAEIAEFYRDLPPPPAPILPKSVNARITGSYPAPVYAIEEE